MAAEGFPNNCKTVNLPSGLTYTCVHFPKPKDSNKPTILFLHGFPSSSYDWHNQINYFSSQGHGVVAPDLLGYGGTSSPEEATDDAFKYKNMSSDIIGILTSCGVRVEEGEKVHAVGHDFGAIFLSTMLAYHPKIALTCTLISVPYSPPGSKLNLDVMKVVTERELGFEFFGYRRFLISDTSWELIDAHKESMFTILYGSDEEWVEHFLPPGRLEAWLKEDRKAPYQDYVTPEYKATRDRIFNKQGASYRGPTYWYRARFRDFVGIDEEAKDLGENVRLPCPTMIMKSEDSNIMPKAWMRRTEPFVDVYEHAEIKGGKTHWVQLEAPAEVNRVLQEFFEKYSE